jgi:hypothetical protein
LRESVAKGGFMAGPPERMVERLLELQAKYPGVEQIHVGQVVGTPKKVILEQLERFAVEVMPVFKERSAEQPRAAVAVS